LGKKLYIVVLTTTLQVRVVFGSRFLDLAWKVE
jgi:hypothetical protein